MPAGRPILHDAYRRESTSAVTWLICAIAGAFVIQFAADSSLLPGSRGLADGLALSREALTSGRLWVPLTFWLLHDTSNLFHVGLVLLGLFLVGHELVGLLGTRLFAGIFIGSLLGGAAGWTACNLGSDQMLIGATAGVYGLLAVYAMFFPNREIHFLLFFFFPITFRPKHVVVSLLAIDLLAFALVDVLGRSLPFAYAPSAHLGGMAVGWACSRFLQEHRRNRVTSSRQTGGLEPAKSVVLAGRSGRHNSAHSAEASRAGMRAEVDRILDKINSRGLDALTPSERKVLEEARNLLGRRQ